MELPSCLKTLMIFQNCFIIFLFIPSTGSTSENRKPRLVHISIGNEVTSSMIIMWSTVSRTGCRVFYDISDKLQFSIEGNVSKLLEDNWNALSYIHRAELTVGDEFLDMIQPIAAQFPYMTSPEAHEHSYERLWPVYHSDVIQHSYLHPRAPVHIISGAGGNSEGVPGLHLELAEGVKNSYGRLSVVNKTHLHFDQISAITKDVLDQFWIVQENHGPFLQNVDCKNGTVLPEFCACPLPIRLVTLLILFTSGIVIVIVLSIMFCCYSCRCCYFCLNNVRTCAHIFGSWMNRRRQYRHQPLQQNTDIEDNFLVYQPTESIDSFDMFVH
ncbi:ACP7 [Mytilus edulis]|uniref:ACP7 n=1 Tax=Mytilus edulis TaxID=6550 RepID=A0A8S3UWP0_MYTED|nr:ACP7 [Mytilus edulis]